MAVVRIYADRVRPKLMVKINVDIGTSNLWIRVRSAENRFQAPWTLYSLFICKYLKTGAIDSQRLAHSADRGRLEPRSAELPSQA